MMGFVELRAHVLRCDIEIVCPLKKPLSPRFAQSISKLTNVVTLHLPNLVAIVLLSLHKHITT